MVLCLKARESRSLPGLKNTAAINAGWSSLVARQAHNLKVAGSNPAPATKHKTSFSLLTNSDDLNMPQTQILFNICKNNVNTV